MAKVEVEVLEEESDAESEVIKVANMTALELCSGRGDGIDGYPHASPLSYNVLDVDQVSILSVNDSQVHHI